MRVKGGKSRLSGPVNAWFSESSPSRFGRRAGGLRRVEGVEFGGPRAAQGLTPFALRIMSLGWEKGAERPICSATVVRPE
jgi:hypothetical protein